MAKAMVEVEIPDGWEFVAYRRARGGETWLCESGQPCLAGNVSKAPLIILRPAWTWPAWLKAPWIAMHSCGEWIAFEDEPEDPAPADHQFYTEGQTSCIDRKLFDFTPPPCDDWRQSKRKNPNL